MPELIEQSTAPTPPPVPPVPAETDPEPPAAATPPTIDPAAWEDFPAFRETFLMYFTPPGYASALRVVGEMLHTMILESYNPWPGWPESSTRTELRAAVADLRHLQGFLTSVGQERKLSSLDVEDAFLSNLAAKLAPQVSKLAGWIEDALDERNAKPEGEA